MASNLERINKLKRTLDEYGPLQDQIQKKIDKKFRLEFNFNSNHMEGNTLTYDETALLLMFDDTIGSHTFREYEEVKAHDVAYQLILDWAKDFDRPFNENDIKNLNKIILVRPYWKEAITHDGQNTRRLIEVGDYKKQPNSVRLSTGEMFEYTSPSDTPFEMDKLVQWYRKEEHNLDPITLATLLHYKLVRIHPFDDGNGRVSRLLMNYVLLKNGFPPIIIKSSDKLNYLRCLHQADIGDYDPFIEYVGNQLIWSLETSIKAANGENIEEVDDLDKEIHVLIKSLNSRPNELSKNSKVVQELWNISIRNLVTKLIDLANKFRKLFNQTNIDLIVSFGGDNKSFKGIEELNGMFSNHEENIKITGLVVVAYFHDMKRSSYNTSLRLDVKFTDLEYNINISNHLNLIHKYGSFMSNNEITDSLKSLGEKFLQEISGHKN